MQSIHFDGGWYCDALPDGRWVATWRDGRISTNLGPIDPPPNGAILPLYPRLNGASAGVTFAGQAWQYQDRALEWDYQLGWAVLNLVACGVSPCIYDNGGLLQVNVGCAVGSQGWRYVTPENVLVTGDATYSPTAQWRLWEWTKLADDLVVGQGADGGCLVWDRGTMRYLIAESAGVCRFIRAVRDGENVSIAYWGQSGMPSAAHFLTMSELRALPVVPTPPVPPEPPVPPVPPIPPIPPVPPVPPMTDTLTSSNGKYRCLMQNDGNFVLYGPTGAYWATGTNQDTPTPPTPQPPVPPPSAAPVLSVEGRYWRNGGQPYLPRWASALTLLTKSLRDRGAYLDYLQATGFNGFRVFCGALTWANQTPDMALLRLPGLLDEAARRGMAVEVSALTDTRTGYDPYAHLGAIEDIVDGRTYVVTELSNEPWNGSQQDLTYDRLRGWGQMFRGLWAPGCGTTDEPTPEGFYDAHGGRYATAHLNRGRDFWNECRRVREIYAVADALNVPCLNNEPTGADEQNNPGKRRNDPAFFATLGALDALFNVGGVHHSQAGLMCEIPGPAQQACAHAYVAASEAAVTPEGWQYKNTGHDGSPFKSSPVGEQPGAVATRIYSFVGGNEARSVVVGGLHEPMADQGWRINGIRYRSLASDGRWLMVLDMRRA